MPLLLPVVYLACQLTYAEVFNWALASFNCLAVVTFAALSLHFLAKAGKLGSPWFVLGLACLSFVLACAASTNGLLLAPLGALLLLHARRLAAALTWCCTAVFSFALYFYRLQPVHHPIGSLTTQVLFLLSFAGGAIENMHRWPIRGAACVLGALLLIVFADAVRTGYYRRNPFFFWMAAWVLSTALVVARFRSILGVSQSLSNRYKIYSMLFLVFAYVYLADRILQGRFFSLRTSRALFAGAVAASVLLSAAGDVTGAQFLARRKHWVEFGMSQYERDPTRYSPLPDPNRDHVPDDESEQRYLSDAIVHGIYTPPFQPEPMR